MRAIHTFTVSTELPAELEPLNRLARNLAWSRHDRVRELFARLTDEHLSDTGFRPVELLASADRERLAALAADAEFVSRARALADRLDNELSSPRWFQLSHQGSLSSVAYFSPEFGIAESLPQYSGGLGILAGDHLKAANDLGLPLTGVGLFYRHGYFRQGVDRNGWQRERYPRLDPRQMAVEDTGAMISIELAGVPVAVRVWLARVGSVELYLLDTDVEGNDEAGSTITDRLYGGAGEQRIRQEIVLGMGGVRALRALGVDTQVFHMNEGHAGFLALERVREHIVGDGFSFTEAIEAARVGTVFTTHTPVPAGIDRFGRDLIERYFTGWAAECGISVDELMALGHEPHTEHGSVFNMACFGLRMSERANGVAQLHGHVSRSMFAAMWPELPEPEVPIGAVTNGVHLRTWTSTEMSDLFERRVGSDWPSATTERWRAGLDEVSDTELWAVRRAARQRLVQYTRRRVRASVMARGGSAAEAAWADTICDPDALTIGFARRFATYKRAALLLSDRDRLRRLLLDAQRPVQLVFAGKAHPADEEGKRVLASIFEAASDPSLRHRVVFLEDYDISVAQAMYHGVDVWLNTPRRPMEACGTSGMKVVHNGALNCSVLDGWWDEMYEPGLGWAIPSYDEIEDLGARDRLEAESLYALLEDEVVPTFFRRGADGLPGDWLAMVRDGIAVLGPQVSASRMVRDYATEYYEPAGARSDSLLGDSAAGARELASWKQRVRQGWSQVGISEVGYVDPVSGTTEEVTARVELGGLEPDDVEVQLLWGSVDADDQIVDPQVRAMVPEGEHYRGRLDVEGTGTYGIAVRVVAARPELVSWPELGLVVWASSEALRA